ncbi:unnamed protein product [Linum tenue]|uniref:Uncharacterized protein n=1 Tax=Linum tenue TaxID=586396 RepID=A0AAV0JY21_9ROSI|nr:unnamed protein product [Linum tenue]
MRLMLTVTYIQWNCHPRSSSSNEVESRKPERYSSAAPLSRMFTPFWLFFQSSEIC